MLVGTVLNDGEAETSTRFETPDGLRDRRSARLAPSDADLRCLLIAGDICPPTNQSAGSTRSFGRGCVAAPQRMSLLRGATMISSGNEETYPTCRAHCERGEAQNRRHADSNSAFNIQRFSARYGAKSCQICCTTRGSTTRVSPFSGSFSEYSTSLTVPHCGPNALGSKAYSPS